MHVVGHAPQQLREIDGISHQPAGLDVSRYGHIAGTRFLRLAGIAGWKIAMRCCAARCAHAVGGHAAAALSSNVMKSRRSMGSAQNTHWSNAQSVALASVRNGTNRRQILIGPMSTMGRKAPVGDFS